MKIELTKKALVFRDNARELIKLLKKNLKKSKIIYLDLSKVEFLSRSFIDELLNFLKKEKKVKVMIRNTSLRRFFDKVKRTKTKIKH
jgi:anti-anti-sigma regulatory factor